MPRTVRMICGLLGSASIFLRRREIRMSMLRSNGFPAPVMRQLEQLIAVEHPVRVFGKDLQKSVFHRGDGDLLAGAVEQLVSVEVEPARAEPGKGLAAALGNGFRSRRRHRPGGPAQHGLEPGKQFAQVDRLGEIVVSAHLQADDPVDDLGIAVSMTMATSLSARSERAIDSPSSPGMVMSSTTASICCSLWISRSAAPSTACDTV